MNITQRLILSRSKDQSILTGCDYSGSNPISPLEYMVTDVKKKQVKIGSQAFLADGTPSQLLKIDRREIAEEICNLSNPNDQVDPSIYDLKVGQSLPEKDKFALDFFLRSSLKINLNQLESAIKKLPNPSSRYSLDRFVDVIKNGAFFKHWADHYTKKAQEMASSLRIAA